MVIKRSSWTKEGLTHCSDNTTHRMLKVMVLDAKSLPLVELSIFGTFESSLLTNTLKKKHP